MKYKKLLFPLLTAAAIAGHAQTITIVAGNGNPTSSGDGGLATAAAVDYTTGMDADSAGNLYLSDQYKYHVRKIGLNDTITKIAGTTYGYSGDGGPATSAQMGNVSDVAVDRHGNVYVADGTNARIRKISTAGIISTYAGNGTFDTLGNGGPTTSAGFVLINKIAIDDSGNLFIADNNWIRKVNTAGVITKVAGKATAGYSGDGGLAVNASFGQLQDLTVDHKGNVYVIDSFYRIRKIGTDGIIHTICGGTTVGYSGDGGPATAATLGDVTGIKADHYNNLYLSIGNGARIRRIDTNGIINSYLGNGLCNYPANGAQLDTAGVCVPSLITVDGHNNIYYYSDDYKIRKISAAHSTSASGVAIMSPGNRISIYPNPATDVVNITNLEIGDYIHVTDMMGRNIPAGMIASQQGSNQMDMTNLATGIYLVHVINNKGMVKDRIKVIKR
jgi:hypothetical protein